MTEVATGVDHVGRIATSFSGVIAHAVVMSTKEIPTAPGEFP